MYTTDCGLTIHEACIAKVQHECEPDLTQFATIFGISLTLLVKATPGCRPPFLLQKCISEIDKRGLHVEGIYRISGSREASDRLKTLLERGNKFVMFLLIRNFMISVIVKHSLFHCHKVTYSVYELIINICKISLRRKRVT